MDILATETFINWCDDMYIAEEGLFYKNKFKDKIKDIISSISEKKVKNIGNFLRTSYDVDTVKKLISSLESSFDKVAYSSITHVTGDYNFYTQGFAVQSGSTICLFTVIYDEKQISFSRLSSYYRELDTSELDFSTDFIMKVYSEALSLSYVNVGRGIIGGIVKIKKSSIIINSASNKLDSMMNRLTDPKYNFELQKNGYKLVITVKHNNEE